MKWKDIAEKMEAVDEALENLEEPKTDLEAFVRVELANQIAAAYRIVNALAADEAAGK